MLKQANDQNKENKELQKIFSLAVKFFEKGDFELARKGFEIVIKDTKEQRKKGPFPRLFREPSLRDKAEQYLKKMVGRQTQPERKTKEKPREIKAGKPSFSARITKKFRKIIRHPLIVGVDISDHSIEILQLDEDRNIKLCARSVLEKGIVESAEIKDADRLGEALHQTIKGAGLDVLMAKKRLRIKGLFSLPESKVFIREFGLETKDNLQDQVKKKIEETVPLSLGEIYWDYINLGEQANQTRILAVAVFKKTIDDYLQFFWGEGIDPVVFDTEAASVARALLPAEKQKSSTAIIDIGARTSIINIFDPRNDLSLSVSVSCAGNYFTQQIAKKLSTSEEEAEKEKQGSGFKKEPVSGVLKECSLVLLGEIKDALKYYQNRFGLRVGKIILSGGSSLLPGIAEHFQENLEEKVETGDPLRNIKPGSFFGDKKEALLFANVIGLAMRGLDKDYIDKGLNLLTDDVKNQEKVLQKEREKFFLYIILYFIVIFIALLAILFTLHRLGLIKLAI